VPNRLADTLSPYLLQHAENPVDWYPWGDEAFERARAEDRPIFLSIGYATCHWCHVMEHESFEDEEVAALLNQDFVSIKVDREERPDVDNLYMTVCQALTGHGGWPLTVFLTPDREPFYVGTYFPRTGRGGRPGMRELLPAVAQAWKDDREKVLRSASGITGAVRESLDRQRRSGEAPDVKTLDMAYNGLAGRFDPEWGGFGSAPKFPTPHDHLFLLREHKRTGERRPLDMVATSLRRMRLGGIWDHVGFGFHRYSTDRLWKLPHFEKMLYDQALLAMAYTEAWQVTREPLFRQTAEDIFAYVERDLTGPEDAFYSAEDADSLNPEGEKEEGAFYVWGWQEWMETLGQRNGTIAAALYNIEREGNYLDEATRQQTGLNVLFQTSPPAEAADRLEMAADNLLQRLTDIRKQLFEVREKRPRPLLDDKVLTDWNGLMIAALSKAAWAFDEPDYAARAARAADFILDTLRDEDGRLLHRYRAGEAGLSAFADDYAYLAWGLVELHQATFDVRWLREAATLIDALLEHFWDEEAGGLFLSADDAEELPVRQKAYYDGATPSANSVAAYVLLRLARLTGRTEWEDRADAILRSAGEIRDVPSGHTMVMLALELTAGRAREIVIAGEPESEDVRALLEVLREGYHPDAIVHLRPTDAAELEEVAPYTSGQTMRDGRAAAYVCEGFACQAPVTEPEELRAALQHANAKRPGGHQGEEGREKREMREKKEGPRGA
jgi:uncharacterized protein